MSEPAGDTPIATGAAVDPAGSAPVPPAPAVRVVRGEPDDVEVAALVAGLLATRTTGDPDDLTRPPGWNDRVRALRGATGRQHGRDVWRWSLHP